MLSVARLRALALCVVCLGWSQSGAAQPDKKTLTICHVAAADKGDKDKSGTLKLSAADAKQHLATHADDFSGTCEGTDFVMVAVSGTLEEGFPLRPNLDFVSPLERINAVFLGHALIRGLIESTKACIDGPAPAPSKPKLPASYAVDKTTKRMIDIYKPCAFEELAARAGQNIQVAQCPN